MLLELKNISKAYENKLVLKDLNLSLEPASINLLIGENGSGKSTLFKIIAGLIKPDKGQVIHKLKKNDIAYLAHISALYDNLSLYENINFWAKYQKIKLSHDDILQLLKRVDLEKYANELVGSFSRGMLQRANLAKILMQDAKLILLDEPATGLDEKSKDILLQEIKNYKAKNSTVFWISHDFEKDKYNADEIFLLENKHLQARGA